MNYVVKKCYALLLLLWGNKFIFTKFRSVVILQCLYNDAAAGEGFCEVLSDRGLLCYWNMHSSYRTHQPGARPVLKPDLQNEVLDLNRICQASGCCLWRMTKYSDLTPSSMLVTSSHCCWHGIPWTAQTVNSHWWKPSLVSCFAFCSRHMYVSDLPSLWISETLVDSK